MRRECGSGDSKGDAMRAQAVDCLARTRRYAHSMTSIRGKTGPDWFWLVQVEDNYRDWALPAFLFVLTRSDWASVLEYHHE